MLHGQSFEDVLKISEYYGKSFNDFENGLSIKSFDKSSKFGLESRIYNFKDCKILIESKNEENSISKFSFLTEKGGQYEELWYQIAKNANANPEFKFIESFISDKNSELYKKDLKFNELVSVLRALKSTDGLIYYIVFKNNNIYYQLNITNLTFYAVVNDQYDKRN